MDIRHFTVVIVPNFTIAKEGAMEEPLEELPEMPKAVRVYDLRKQESFPNEILEVPQLSPAELPSTINTLYLSEDQVDVMVSEMIDDNEVETEEDADGAAAASSSAAIRASSKRRKGGS